MKMQPLWVLLTSPTAEIYLPASFLGSHHWATEQVSDSLAVATRYGPPKFFITMTCNMNCPEIQSQLCQGQDFMDIPVFVMHILKQKLALLEQALKTIFPNAGDLLYCIHSIEFQKHGVPHAHILLKFHSDCITAADIDAVVFVEIPSNPQDTSLVRNCMIHRHLPSDKPMSKYCQCLNEDGQRICHFHYPHALQATTSIDSCTLSDATILMTNGLYPIVYHYCECSNAIWTLKWQTPHIYFNIYSTTSTKVQAL